MKMTDLLKKNIIAIAVLCAMPNGYRRAGIALNQGDNSPLNVDEAQHKALEADPNLKVTVLGEGLSTETELDTGISSLEEQNVALKGEIISLSNQLAEVKQQLTAAQGITDEDSLADLASARVVVDSGKELDASSAPEELHHWIAVIDDINKEGNLSKKPNCDHLTITVNGEPLTPTAAERDAAWDWYQENVVIASTDANSADAEA